jgi:hypothetical protein
MEEPNTVSGAGHLPFDRYEIQAIFIPGFIFTLSMLITLLSVKLDYKINAFDQIKKILNPSDKYVVLTIVIILLFLLISYIVGQVLDALSELIYNRIIFKKLYGHPFEIILKNEKIETNNFLYTLLLIIIIIPLSYVWIGKEYDLRAYEFKWDLFLIWLLPVALMIFIIFLISLSKPAWEILPRIQKTSSFPVRFIDEKIIKFFNIKNPIDDESISRIHNINKNPSLGLYWELYWKTCDKSAFANYQINKAKTITVFCRSISLSFLLSAFAISASFKERWYEISSNFILSRSDVQHVVWVCVFMYIVFYYKFVLAHISETKSVFRSYLSISPSFTHELKEKT